LFLLPVCVPLVVNLLGEVVELPEVDVVKLFFSVNTAAPK
jgi:hypothetical protein